MILRRLTDNELFLLGILENMNQSENSKLVGQHHVELFAPMQEESRLVICKQAVNRGIHF